MNFSVVMSMRENIWLVFGMMQEFFCFHVSFAKVLFRLPIRAIVAGLFSQLETPIL